jgi:hypothetical protein
VLPRYEAASGRVSAKSKFYLLEIAGKQKAPAQLEQGLLHFQETLLLHFGEDDNQRVQRQ